MVLIVAALLLVGAVAMFAWLQDRELRGGVLRQRAEAQRRPDWVPLEALPPYVPRAFLAVVDPGFADRGSLDDVEAPTLTRELLRQLYRLNPGPLESEARELVMAPLLEHRLDRREVLELYLNRVYLGAQEGWPVFGVHGAAREYFDKEPRAMTVGEAATLAGLLLPPRITDPGAAPGAVGARRNEVLRLLVAQGAITPAAYGAAIREPLAFQPGVRYAPMTRPAGWNREPEVIRVPANPPADSVAEG